MSMELPSDDLILDVRNLRVEFNSDKGHAVAVNNLSFSLPRGDTLGIVGESGSGKSITSLSALKLIPKAGAITSGEILFNSKKFGWIDILKCDKQQIRYLRGGEIAMIFQDPMSSLNPVFTCGNQVAENLVLHKNMGWKAARTRTIALFEQVHLPRPEHIFDAYPHQISGGQKQRVMIAMALACSPSILIADEPTTALDVTVQKTILDLMQEIREEHNTSTIFITHDLGVVAEVTDRVMVMYRGEVKEEGTVWDIFSDPKHGYTKGLLACRPRLDIKLSRLPTVSDFMADSKTGKVAKFQSVGQAIMMNVESEEELREKAEEQMKQSPILRVKDLQVHFPMDKTFFGKPKGWVRAVDGVSFEVYPGETLGLVGESGCGKTTLGRTILRLVEPTFGEINFQGEDITKVSNMELRRLRRDIQIVFQDPYASLNPRLTIGESILEPMRVHHVFDTDAERRDYVYELLETVNLSSAYYDYYPHEFSGGQRQRICIARILAIQPKFIIFDESVSALDVSVQAQVLNLMNDLKRKYNLTYIFISHDLSVVKFIADRIMVMNKGSIEEIDFTTEIYDSPKTEYTKRLIESIPRGDLADIRKAMLRRKKAAIKQQ